MQQSTFLRADSVALLQFIFGTEWEDAWVCWKSNMYGRRVRDLKPGDLPPNEDCYFCIATLKDGGRSGGNALRVRALVIDDVGTKINPEHFELMAPVPNWVIESSPGNFQMGYFIDMPVADYDALRAAMKGSPIWGKSDGVDAVHLFRLPQGMNTKNSQSPFRVKMVSISVSVSKSPLDTSVFGSLQGSGSGSGAPGFQGVSDTIEDAGLLMALVASIPNDQPDRQRWVDVAHAIWGASSGTGFAVFDTWSASWTAGTDDPAANAKLWAGIRSSSIGRGWLIRAAGAAGQKWMGAEAASVFDDGVDVMAAAAASPGQVTPLHRTVAWEIEKECKRIMRFCHDTGEWYVFAGAGWETRPDKQGFLKAWTWVDRHIVRFTPAEVKQVSKADFFSGVEIILRQRLGIRLTAFDQDIWLLGTPGGTVDLRTGALRAADPADFISKLTAVTPSETEDCPTFRKFMAEITKGDAGASHFIQQWLGYCLTGDISEQKFLFLYGPGGNGKSVLMDTASWIMNGYFRKPVFDLYFAKAGTRHMQEVAQLAGARMITVSEVPPNASWDEGKLKDHTGGGQITANFMRQNSFSFVPQFKLTCLGNHQPQFPGGMNPAIKRRFKLMLLDFVPKVVDPDLVERFKKEGPGILRWMLSGLAAWHRTRLLIPQAVDDATDKYIHDQDVFGLWLEQRVEKRPGAKTGTTDLFQDWQDFSARNAGGDLYKTTVAFASEMSVRGYQKTKLKTNNVYIDIVLISKAKSVF